MANDGKDFEEAVHRFVQSLGAGATVRFDYKTPDRDTGTLRQCDVWVEGRFQGHFPLKYLISCKDKGRKLNIEDIGAFKSQIDSVGASSGAIYSRKGFTKPAIKKAKVMGLACCRLYTNQPADVPEIVILWGYAVTSTIRLSLHGLEHFDRSLLTWDDLFALQLPDESGITRTVADVIANAYKEGEEESLANVSKTAGFPENFVRSLQLSPAEAYVGIHGGWRRYRAPRSAHLLNGSYSLTDGSFRGEQYSPSIDRFDPPGKHWIEMTNDETTPEGQGRVLMIMRGPDVRRTLREHFSGKRLGTD